MPKIGDVIDFTPSAFDRISKPINSKTYTPVIVRGVVIAVNEAHRHYTVEAEIRGERIRECFRY